MIHVPVNVIVLRFSAYAVVFSQVVTCRGDYSELVCIYLLVITVNVMCLNYCGCCIRRIFNLMFLKCILSCNILVMGLSTTVNYKNMY